MRHRVAHRKLGRVTAHRTALLRNLATALFAESQSRLLVEVAPGDLDRFRDVMHEPVLLLGHVSEAEHLLIPGVDPIDVEDLADAFTGTLVDD